MLLCFRFKVFKLGSWNFNRPFCQMVLFHRIGLVVTMCVCVSDVQSPSPPPPGVMDRPHVAGVPLVTVVSRLFFPNTDILTEMHNKVVMKRWGYHNNLFPAYMGWTQDQLLIGRHPHKDLKWTELCLGPIQTRLEAFLGFLVKPKWKLTQNWLL